MADLSPAAQAVLHALLNTPVNSRQLCNGRASQIKLAAAIRALADQVVPHTAARTDGAANRRRLRRKLLAIADELES
jgi:hypothetical protein